MPRVTPFQLVNTASIREQMKSILTFLPPTLFLPSTIWQPPSVEGQCASQSVTQSVSQSVTFSHTQSLSHTQSPSHLVTHSLSNLDRQSVFQSLSYSFFSVLQVKSERDDLTKKLKRKEDALERIEQETSLLSEQVEVTKQDQNDSMQEQDVILRDRFGKADSVRKLSTELTKSQQRNIEMDARVTSLEEKSETYKRERDHAKEQWRQSVKERKRLHREIASIVQARDEAIQKCFSTAEQLEKLKEEYNHLLNRLAKTGLSANNSSELSIPCSLKECKFCAGDSAEGLEVSL